LTKLGFVIKFRLKLVRKIDSKAVKFFSDDFQIPLEPPILPSLDELAVSVPDNASFPMTESPPPGYMTDENEPVS
jgi:hypothetical protein